MSELRVGSIRAEEWAATMSGHLRGQVRLAHADSQAKIGNIAALGRQEREERQDLTMAPGATRATGGGNRATLEQPDPLRTCFERDRDRILHEATAFRRLAGKTQVFIFPEDHQRTRLTHALEVAQVAVAIASAVGANVALVEAIALGHDCGHGPGGHASEDAFSPFIEGGYNHATWGADVVLAPLNLCVETLDGIRNHSWSLPSPSTVEGEIVSWADRIAYVCHDFEDAVHVGIVTPEMLPDDVAGVVGSTRRRQLHQFITAMIATIADHGVIGMDQDHADALRSFRAFNYEHIYTRPASLRQAEEVIQLLQALVEYYADRPHAIPDHETADRRYERPPDPPCAAGSPAAFHAAVRYVAGMTDRYAYRQASQLLDWPSGRLPIGIG